MGAISAAAVGTVGVATALLGSRGRKRRQGADGLPSGEQARSATLTPYEPEAAASADEVAEVAEVAGEAPSPAEAPVPTVLAIIPRAQWGAVEPQVSPGGAGERGFYDAVANPDGWMVYAQPPEEVVDFVIIHHSALPLTDGPVEIQRLHMEEKGFADVGYQYLINETGQLFEGRALNVRGAHTYNYNYGSTGICLIGNFEEIRPTAAQLGMLRLLLNDLTARFPRIYHLAGHKDCNSVTLCPGENLYALLPEIAREHGLTYGIG